MHTSADAILTVNAGSSSIKLEVFGSDMARLFAASVSGIGTGTAAMRVQEFPSAPTSEEVQAATHAEASDIVLEWLARSVPATSICAVGHRLVHGGGRYSKPTPVGKIHDSDWQVLSQLDPQHTPAAHRLVKLLLRKFPSVPHIACFDTAFFHDMPEVAKILPIPHKYFKSGIRRYGFHGLSYTSLLDTFQQNAGVAAANGRVIMAHLGNGASITATRDGKPVDTTMGFTPTSGIVMSTRSGDLDPHVFHFLHHQHGMELDEFENMVSFESGLLGVSGLSDDMKTLLDKEPRHKGAAAAIELYVQTAKKAIGGLAAVLGGVDSLVFSGGVGEQSSVLRGRICQGLGHLGIEIDEPANTHHAFLISGPQSRAGVHVIASDEAMVIATQTNQFLQKAKEPA